MVADGLHMSTHAGAMLIAALAYTYARKHASDSRFVLGTGKLGDLAGFTSAIALAMIALLIGDDEVSRLLRPVPIHFSEAIPISVVGLLVNLASVWLLGGSHHGHDHGHSHGDGHKHHAHDDESRDIDTPSGVLTVSIFEEGMPPVFRITAHGDRSKPVASAVSITTLRLDGADQGFAFAERGAYLESAEHIPEPHSFKAIVGLPDGDHTIEFEEHEDHHEADGATHRDHNIPSAFVHMIADDCRIAARYRWRRPGKDIWLGVDKPACGHYRRSGYRKLVI